MYFYGEQNKSRWEGGAKKIKKRYQYFFKKGVFKGGTNVAKGGDQKIFLARLRAQILPPPLNKSPRTPLDTSNEKFGSKENSDKQKNLE